MRFQVWPLVGCVALAALALAGCGQSDAAKIDLTNLADNQVALNVEGMV
jgi:hypothetical protein